MKIAHAEFNEYLNGFVCYLDDGRRVNVQFERNTNKLSGNYNLHFPTLDECNDHVDLSNDDIEQFWQAIEDNKEVNSAINDYATMLDNKN